MKSPAKLDLSFGNGLGPGIREIALSAISHVTNCISWFQIGYFVDRVLWDISVCYEFVFLENTTFDIMQCELGITSSQ